MAFRKNKASISNFRFKKEKEKKTIWNKCLIHGNHSA